MKKILYFFKLARVQYIPIIIFPVVVGSIYAADNSVLFETKFWICLIGAVFAQLGANAANDYFDWIRGADKYCKEMIPELDKEPICGSKIIANNFLTEREALFAALLFFAVSFLCGLYFVFTVSWFVLVFAFVGFYMGFFYCSPRVGFGYIGRGLSEIAIFIAFGILPVFGSYYVMGGKDFTNAFYASIPFGLIATMIVYHNHFSHIEADRMANKKSPPVVLGRGKSKIVAKALVILSAISVILMSAFDVYSIYAAIAAVPFVILIFLPWKDDIRGDILRMKQVSFLSLLGGFLIMVSMFF